MTLSRKENLCHLGLQSHLVNELELQVAPLADPTKTSPNLILETTGDNLVAAGTTQANALALTAQTNRVTTAGAGSGVTLPASLPGLEITIINHGANPLQVYGAGTDQINDIATATGVTMMISSTVLFWCSSAGLWYSEGLGTGYTGSFQTQSYTGSITAHAGGGQGSAVPLTTMLNEVTTVGTAADSVLLPAATPGLVITVANGAAANSLNVFPSTGDSINAGAANAAFAVAAAKTAQFTCMQAGKWRAILSA